MVVEFGHFALALALGVALIQCAAPLSGLALRDMRLMALAAPAAILTFLMLVVAWAALTHAFIASDFSVAAVAQNSHSAKALMYRISGVWAGHEGSMLLWVLCLGGYGAALAGAGGTAPTRLRSLAIGVEGLLTAVFSAYILLFSNPFLRVVPPPEDGAGLNPILEDPGLAFHPPLLYLGYVGFSVTFAFAVAALMSNRVDALWARVVRPWTLGAWVFLTLGIGVGSFWAYYELGWGGWWNWDPVENASFMPWLSGLALIHATTVTERRGALKNWTVFLSLLTFSLSVLGTFLVRSGILTSVHAFVADPARGSAILAVLLAVSGGSLALFAWRAPTLTPGASFALVSREGALVLNNLFLAAACATVFVGSLYPLVVETLSDERISVGAPYFNMTFILLGIPLLLVLPVGQALHWNADTLKRVLPGFAAIGAVAVLAGFVTAVVSPVPSWLAPVGAALGFYVCLGAFQALAARGRDGERRWRAIMRRIRSWPGSAWGTVLAHAGVGVLVGGIAASVWGSERLTFLDPGSLVSVGPFSVHMERVLERRGADYNERAVRLEVFKGAVSVGVLEPARRYYPAHGITTTEAAILRLGLGHVYATVGEFRPDGKVAVHLFDKPFVLLLWLGAGLMALGGVVSLVDVRAHPSRRVVGGNP